MMSCPFCDQDVSLADGVFLENALVYVREDKFPVSPGHLLVIPRRHAVDWFDLSADEQAAVADLINRAKCWLDEQHRPDGYNIGMNCGRAAGQRSEERRVGKEWGSGGVAGRCVKEGETS